MDRSSAQPMLTLAVTVANNNAGLKQTLASVHEFVDQIVVCDNGEAECAAAVVAEFDGRYIAQPWCDSFSLARNEGLRHASGRWILQLDAGETMLAADLADLRAQLAMVEPKSAYLLLVKVPPTPNTIDGEQVARIRVFPNRPEIRYQGRVRESVRPALERLGISIEGLPFRIYRDEQEHDPDRRQMRARRNIELADMELRESGPQPRLANCMAEAFVALDQTYDGAALYRQVLETAPEGSPELLEAYYGLLTLEEHNRDPEPRVNWALQALQRFPLDMQLLCAMGGYLQAAGRRDLALRSYETAYRFGQIQPELWHMDQLRAIAAECYALCLQLHGDVPAAQGVLEEALGQEPGSDRLRRQLLDVLVRTGQRDGALQLLTSHPPATPHLEALRSAVRGACLAVQQNWIAARAYLQVAYQAGCRDALCLRWLAVTLMSTGDNPAATEILQEWQRHEPANLEPQRYLEAIQSAPDDSAEPRDERPLSDRQLRVDGQQAEVPADAPHAKGAAETQRSSASRGAL